MPTHTSLYDPAAVEVLGVTGARPTGVGTAPYEETPMSKFLLALSLLFAACSGTSDDGDVDGVCDADGACVCVDNESCACNADSCDIDCTATDSCAAQCGDGTCDVDCTGVDSCAVECSDSTACNVDCSDSASCAVTCPDSGCTVEGCTLEAGCTVTCGMGGVATYSGGNATCP